MTVKELFVKLQHFIEQGQGDLTVCVEHTYGGLPEAVESSNIEESEYYESYENKLPCLLIE